jgi:tetratricopeptide (TPR) repeat protein
MLERYPESEAAYRKLLELRPGDLQGLTNLANLAFLQERRDEASRIYIELIKALPDDPAALNEIAWTLADRDLLLDRALELAKRAATAVPTEPAIADTLGWVHFKRNELDDAEAWLKKSIELFAGKPEAADVWVHLGAVYEKKVAPEKAKEAYRKALALDPNHKAAGEALKRLGGEGSPTV